MAAVDDKACGEDGRPGDQEGFEDLVRQNQRMIHSLCYRLTGSMEEAEDLAQETFVQACRHFEEFRGEAKVSSWLYRIAVNRCLNWRRRREREHRLHEEWSREAPATGPGDSQRAQQVQEVLMKLPAKQRAAVVLTTYDGLTHQQAARALGCSEATVSWRVFAARHKLKRLLKRLGTSGGQP